MAIEKNLKVNLTAVDNLSPIIRRAAKIINSEYTKSLQTANQSAQENTVSQEYLVKSILSSNLSMRAKAKTLKVLSKDMEKTNSLTEALKDQNEQLVTTLDMLNDPSAFSSISNGLQRIADTTLAVGGAFIGLAVIKQTFVPIKLGLISLEEYMLKVSFRADELVSNMAAFGPASNKISQSFRTLKTSMSNLKLSEVKEGFKNISKKGLTTLKAGIQSTTQTIKAMSSSVSPSILKMSGDFGGLNKAVVTVFDTVALKLNKAMLQLAAGGLKGVHTSLTILQSSLMTTYHTLSNFTETATNASLKVSNAIIDNAKSMEKAFNSAGDSVGAMKTSKLNLFKLKVSQTKKQVILLSKALGSKMANAFKIISKSSQSTLTNIKLLSKSGFKNLSLGVKSFGKIIVSSGSSLVRFAKSTAQAGSVGLNFGKTMLTIGKHTEFFHKGLLGTVARAGAVGSAFGIMGYSLLQADTLMKRLTGVTLIALGAAFGGFAYIVQQAAVALGGFITKMGNSFTKASTKQIEYFAKAEQSTFAFLQTLRGYSHSAEEASKATETWNGFIKKTNSSTGQTTASLRKLVAETVGATHAFGLNQKEMETLISRSIDLSERAHKPAINTLTALINAVNGNSSGLAVYGLHLNSTAIKQSNLNQELKDNFNKLGDVEKGQARYNVLMEQAGLAAGFASSNADTYSKALKLQKNATKELMQELGKGGQIINGQVVMGLAKLTSGFTNLVKPILPAIGFIQALSGRLMQVGGVLLQNSLLIGLVTSSLGALNAGLASSAGMKVFSSQLPFINKSLSEMAMGVTGVAGKFGSLKEVAGTGLSVLKVKVAGAIKSILGMEAASKLTARSIAVSLISSIKAATIATWKWVVANKVLLIKITIIIAIAAALYKAVTMLEERFKIFSKVVDTLSKAFASVADSAEKANKSSTSLAEILSGMLGTAIKVVAVGILALVNGIMTLTLAVGGLSQIFNYLGLSSLAMSDKKMQGLTSSIMQLSETMGTLSGEVAGDVVNGFISTAGASDKVGHSVKNLKQNLEKLSSSFNKIVKEGEAAFEFVSDLTPSLNLQKIKADSAKFSAQLQKIITKGQELNQALIKSGSDWGAVDKNSEKILAAMEALEANKIKIQQETRNSQIAQVQIGLDQEMSKVFTTEMEIAQMKRDQAVNIKDMKIELLTQELITKRKLEAKYGLSNNESALLAANETELQMFEQNLQAKMALSISSEQQKQAALANIKAGLLGGTSAGAGAEDQAEIINTEIRMNKIKALKMQGKISEIEMQKSFNEISDQLELELSTRRQARANAEIEMQKKMHDTKLAAIQEKTMKELELQTQRAELLGLTDDGLAAQMAKQEEQHQLELERLQFEQENKVITEDQFRLAREQREIQHKNKLKEIELRFYQDKAKIAQDAGNRAEQFRARMRASQIKNGQALGAIMAVQQTSEYKNTGKILDMTSKLRGSKDKDMFEVGKAAAITSSIMNTFAGATAALAPPPVGAGPLLGPLLAGVTVAAGIANVAQIKAQKFGGGQAHGGMDSIPQSMSDKSFLLKGGERVLQPEANKDLTGYLKDRKEGSGGNTYNFTINADRDSNIEGIKQAVIEGIREASERGEPIISDKGVIAS